MNTDQQPEVWHVEANGKECETDFAEMTSWIGEGSLVRTDRVRKGNLRWIEAGKVPSLLAVFNAKDNGQPPPPVVTTTKLGPTVIPGDVSRKQTTFEPIIKTKNRVLNGQNNSACGMHPDVPAVYICETCSNLFCKSCPTSYGSNVKICPFCGAMCTSIANATPTPTEHERYYAPVDKRFGFSDFVAALAYPLKFKSSLILGAVMFMFLSVGQMVVSFGGIFMMIGAITCFMLANTLTFGILANTVEKFSQAKIGEDFMPSFEDFSLWEDVVHPFFLMIGVYISSFGPLLAVALVGFFLFMGSVTQEISGIKTEAARTVSPGAPSAANATRQFEKIDELMKQTADKQKNRVEAMESREFPTDKPLASQPGFEDDQAEEMARFIQESQKGRLEAAIGQTPETLAAERAALFQQFLGFGTLFLVAIGISLLWGLFYFPAACAVAGYTRSLGASLNPLIGLDTIRHLSIDYVKILFMGLILAVVSGIFGGFLAVVLSPFDLPRAGNLPAAAIGSLFGFYLSVVFACVLGFALYKSAEKLKLSR